MNQFNWDQAFTLDFDLNNGLSKHADTTKRYLSQMKNMYQDQEAVEEILKHEDPLIYEFYELGCPERQENYRYCSQPANNCPLQNN